MDHELREASSEEHDCLFFIVGVEESAWDVMVATSRRSWASMVAVIMMLSVATVGEVASSFLYLGRVRSLLPSATAHALTLLSHFLTMFMYK